MVQQSSDSCLSSVSQTILLLVFPSNLSMNVVFLVLLRVGTIMSYIPVPFPDSTTALLRTLSMFPSPLLSSSPTTSAHDTKAAKVPSSPAALRTLLVLRCAWNDCRLQRASAVPQRWYRCLSIRRVRCTLSASVSARVEPWTA